MWFCAVGLAPMFLKALFRNVKRNTRFTHLSLCSIISSKWTEQTHCARCQATTANTATSLLQQHLWQPQWQQPRAGLLLDTSHSIDTILFNSQNSMVRGQFYLYFSVEKTRLVRLRGLFNVFQLAISARVGFEPKPFCYQSRWKRLTIFQRVIGLFLLI